jgi:alkanesulfonate monooxygenase SsuD/methylene tetrahydromethanopterin reductase-like flavin-dependent oxidoreductase (luciferase family)
MCTVSTPEVMYAAVAMRTHRIRIRPMSFLTSFHHPITIAERLAALDIFSNGRMELTTARGNTLLQLDAFGISLDESKGRQEEATEVIIKALSQDTFSHDGHYWKIPERSLTPKALQYPHMPMHKITKSYESALEAGRDGLGLVSSCGFLGYEFFQSLIDGYREGQKNPEHIVRRPTDGVALTLLGAGCETTTEKAIEVAGPAAVHFASRVTGDFGSLAKRSDQYQWAQAISDAQKYAHDIDYLNNNTTAVLCGDPDTWIERLKRYESMGVGEVVIGLDGMSHEDILRNIQMIGRHVIPHFKYPHAIVTHGPVTGASEFQHTKAAVGTKF